LELNELPSSIAFVGGEYISFEFAHIAAIAGPKVTILHRGTRPLNNFDPYLVDMLLQKTHELGIDVRLQTKVEAIESSKVHNNNNIRFGIHASNTNDGEKGSKPVNYNTKSQCYCMPCYFQFLQFGVVYPR
jgi:pyruvate/2-oxoglutarate dehydrogenase complex dihydrolipoamide dehydrogenase (E3) component